MAEPTEDSHAVRVMRYIVVDWLREELNRDLPLNNWLSEETRTALLESSWFCGTTEVIDNRHYSIQSSMQRGRGPILEFLIVHWLPHLDPQPLQPIPTTNHLTGVSELPNFSGLYRVICDIDVTYQYLISMEIMITSFP